MNVLIFSDADAQTLIKYQSGQHRLAPVQLTDGRWFLMADILSEIEAGLFKDKLNVSYTVDSFDNIEDLLIKSDLEEF
jgi:NADH pyrophosphatase NudC (nudix superfamily)